MRFPLILALLITPAAVLAQPAAVPDWKPFHVFIGTWEGTRSSPSGAGVKVVRTYETGEGSHQLDVTEGSGKSRAPWGTVHYDQGKSAFVLDQNKATDDPFELVLNHVSEDGSELIDFRHFAAFQFNRSIGATSTSTASPMLRKLIKPAA